MDNLSSELEQIRCRQFITSIGAIARLKMSLQPGKMLEEILAYADEFKIYNPSKDGCGRYGLSITSHDGQFSGIPDLTSLSQYNREHGCSLDEGDFTTHTPFFESSKELDTFKNIFGSNICRSHVLKFDQGGFFPPHRDGITIKPEYFRIFLSLENIANYEFILDGRCVDFDKGHFYFINTSMMHSLFSYKKFSYFLVFNIKMNYESIKNLRENLSAR